MKLLTTAMKSFFSLVLIVALSLPVVVGAAEYRQAAALIDIRSTFSDGAYDIDSVVELAKKRGFEILVINDHDRMAMEYGLFPFQNIIKKRVELESINEDGAEDYLNAIRYAQQQNPDMIVIPGSESAPFYYWTGSPLKGNLTAHNHEKRLLTMGMNRADDYEQLPIIHNGPSTANFKAVLPELILFTLLLCGGFVLFFWRGRYRVAGGTIILWAILSLANSSAWQSSPFDQYHGDQGIAPYQLVIDYVNRHGGIAVWNYPETKSGVRKLGPIFVSTPPYPGALLESHDYTAFSALYGDNITVTDPGNIWDMVLDEYCRGVRKKPVWGIATADFHEEGGAGEKLGNFVTVFLLKEKSVAGALQALKEGKIYAYQGKYPQMVRLEEFTVQSPDGGTKGVSGDEITVKGYPQVWCTLTTDMVSNKPAKVRLIRSGIVVQTYQGPLPLNIHYEDQTVEQGKTYYYRIDMKGEGILMSNPIFVRCKGVDTADNL
jgi:hypothetical protein